MKIGIVANAKKAGTPGVLAALREAGAALGVAFVVPGEEAATADAVGGTVAAEGAFGNAVDAVVSVGGDGTVLRAVRLLDGTVKPILGINAGHLGFLTGVGPAEAAPALSSLAAGQCAVTRHPLLRATVRRADAEETHRALNDVVLGWNSLARVARVAVEVDGERAGEYVCDGMIVATPLGSTGHALSAGGPILHRAASAMVLQPICAHTLSSRTLVLPAGARVRLAVESADGRLMLSVDGQSRGRVDRGDTVDIAWEPDAVAFARPGPASWFALLAQKLDWRGAYTAE